MQYGLFSCDEVTLSNNAITYFVIILLIKIAVINVLLSNTVLWVVVVDNT